MSDAKLGAVVKEAMKLWDHLKANGSTLKERQRGLENVLRAHWPRGRPWHWLCETCEDTGLVMLTCPGDASCGRVRPHGGHTYGRPCVCAKGRPFDPKPRAGAGDYAQAGKGAKSFTRAGR